MTKHRGTTEHQRQVTGRQQRARYDALTADQDTVARQKQREQLGPIAFALRNQAPPPTATAVQANTESLFELHKTIDRLKKRLDDLRATQTRELDEHLVKSNRQLSDISALRKELAAKNQHISMLEAKLAQAMSSLHKETQSKQNAQSTADRTLAQLRQKITVLESQHTSDDTRIGVLSEQNLALNSEITALKASNIQAEQAQSTIEKLEQQLTELRAENSQALHQIKHLEQTHTLSQHEHDEATTALKQTHATELGIIAAQNWALVTQIVTLRKQLATLKASFDRQKRFLNNVRTTHHELHKAQADSSASATDQPPPTASNNEGYGSLISTLITQVDELTRNNKVQKERNEELTLKLNTLEARLALHETTPPRAFTPFSGTDFFATRRGSLTSEASDASDTPKPTGSPIGSRPSPSSPGSDGAS